jgi:AraC-like DNA-binding protein
MLNSTALISSPDLHVHDVRCSHPPAAWSGTGAGTRSAVVFARSGVFRRRARHGEDVIEPGVAYLQPAGEEDEFAHPHGGDACTAIRVSDELLAALIAEPELPAGVVHTLPNEDLALRTLRSEDDAVVLLASVFGRVAPARVVAGRPSTAAARRALAADAREALACDPALGLVELGRLVGASPHHLSRVFRDEVGVSVSRYRRELRLRRALEGLDGDLARVAADAGFADHAHFSREARALLGVPPSVLRRQVAGGGCGSRAARVHHTR